MEKLVYLAIGVGIASFAGLLGSLWLIHTAVNDGNVWKGLFGLILAGFCGLTFVRVAAVGVLS
jgi:hypothetical protein